MLIFGGNTHSDTVSSTGAKCHSSEFLSYKLRCNRWISMPKPHLQYDLSRFGHTAIASSE